MWWLIVSIVAGVVVCYAILPNLLTRVLRVGAVTRGPVVPAVALTFDDGPDPKYTPELLNRLRAGGVSATFFVIAQKALQNPDLIDRMIAEGHDVQVHGDQHLFVPWLHPRSSWKQVMGTARQLRDRFGLVTHYYRPTWGLCNAVSFLPQVRRTHRLITWSIMVGDWRVTPAEELLRRILGRIHPGAIIVLHDSDATFGAETGAPIQVVELIPELIRQVHDRGYEFRTVAEWL